MIPWDTDLAMTQVQEKDGFSLISDNYKKILLPLLKGQERGGKTVSAPCLLVTDYICGMTDSYAKDMYQELNGIV